LAVPIGQVANHEGIPTIFFERIGHESFKWSPGLTRWLHAHVKAFDLVHIHGVLSHPALAAARACRRHGVPYLMRPLGTLDPWSLGRHAWRKRLLLAWAGRRALTGAARIHFTSDDEERRSRKALPWLPTGVVVPLGIDDDLFTDGTIPEPKDTPYLLALSRLDPKKGVDLLIRAFHAVAGAAPEWRLIIAGDGSPAHVAELQALALAGPAASRITFCGWVGGEARRTWLRGATLFALPSHQENFGIAVVQAMAAGVAVLVSPGVSLAQEIEAAEAGWVTERETLAATLTSVLGDREACHTRGLTARRYAERYRWSRVGRVLTEMYADVAHGTPSNAPAGMGDTVGGAVPTAGGHR
jgi:glycosyltransferase involved in cell wall biosynthesis